MKKIYALTLVLMTMLAMFRCATADEKTTITFGFWGDTAEANMKMQLAEEYMKLHPDVDIEFEYTDGSGYLTKMQTWFSSNTAPDVFGVATDHLAIFNQSTSFENLSPYIERDGLGDMWNKNVQAAYVNKKGETIAVPFISKVFVLAYNKTLFDEAGITYPTDEWTVDDMLAAARALTKGEGISKVYGLRWGVRPTEFYRNLYGTPVYELDSNEVHAVDNPGFKSAVSLFVDTIKEGLAPNETGGTISTGGFETGRFGMQLSATWDISSLIKMAGDSFEWDLAMLPINAELNERMRTTLRGNGWSMNKNAENKEICWDFIKFMTTTEQAMGMAQQYGIPEMAEYAHSDAYLKDYDGMRFAYDKSAFLRMLDYAVPFSNMGVHSQINDVIKADYEMVLADAMTVDEMIEDVQKQADALMKMAQ